MADDEQLLILNSALKHGVEEKQIRHALRRARLSIRQSDGLDMVIGPTFGGDWLEVGIVNWYGGERAVVHAMPARVKYLRFVDETPADRGENHG